MVESTYQKTRDAGGSLTVEPSVSEDELLSLRENLQASLLRLDPVTKAFHAATKTTAEHERLKSDAIEKIPFDPAGQTEAQPTSPSDDKDATPQSLGGITGDNDGSTAEHFNKKVTAKMAVWWTIQWLYENEFWSTVKSLCFVLLQAAWVAGQPFVIMKLFESGGSDSDYDDMDSNENFFQTDGFITLLWVSAVLIAGEVACAQLVYLFACEFASGATFICGISLNIVRHVLETNHLFLETVNISHVLTMLESDIKVLNSNIDALLTIFSTAIQLVSLIFTLFFSLSKTLTVGVCLVAPVYIIYNQL
eukprot:gene12202-14413_t